MWCKLDQQALIALINRQVSNYWECELPKEAYPSVEKALKRLEICFSKVKSGYFRHNGEIAFKIEHSVQYAVWLYILSNQLYKDGFEENAAFVYYLNKIMHAVDWFYAIELPEMFLAEHPLASVLGRASYGNRFFVYQGVTVGGNRKGDELYYPEIGENVLLYADSKILGKSKIGNNVIVSVGTIIKDAVIPDNSIVFGQSPNLIIRTKSEKDIKDMMRHIWIFEEDE